MTRPFFDPPPVWLCSGYDHHRHAFLGTSLTSGKKTAVAVCNHSVPRDLLREDDSAPMDLRCIMIVGGERDTLTE